MATLKFGKYTVETSNTDKVFFPDEKITKGDVIEYYHKIADSMLPYLKNRPLAMQRFPDGLDGESFFQKDISDYFPGWIDRMKIRKEDGSVTHVVCNNTATLVYLANQACLTPHIWLSRVDKLDYPDRLVFDLDPPSDDFASVRDAAQLALELFDELKLSVFVQTTGSRGVHLVVPLAAGEKFDAVRDFAQKAAQSLVDDHGDSLTVEQRKDKRGNRVFIDTNRNAYGQLMVAPYSVRARKGAPVATPIEREELGNSDLTSQSYTLKNIFRRLGQRDDPWSGMARSAQSLKDARRKLEKMMSK
jgi:bifunctional non-homologous end joining protein LigD